MAEGRMLKKAISTSRRLADLQTDSARMLYTWIIPHLDVEGRFYADPAMIKGAIVPRIKTFTETKINECIRDMADVGLIILYGVDGDNYLQLRKFEDHQNIKKEREAPSKIPAPSKNITINSGPTPENSGPTQEQIQNSTAQDKIREVKISKDKGAAAQFVLPEWIKPETWDAFKEMRQKKRAPMTRKAMTLIVKELEKLRALGNNPEDVLNQSIMKSWTGVFPLSKGNGNGKPWAKPEPQQAVKEYVPEDMPDIPEEQRQKNLEQIRQFTANIGRGSPGG